MLGIEFAGMIGCRYIVNVASADGDDQRFEYAKLILDISTSYS